MSPLDTIRYAWAETTLNIKRAGRETLLILVMLIPIAAMGGLLLLQQTALNRRLDELTVTVTAYLSQGLSPYEEGELRDQIARLPGVAGVEMVRKDEAWRELREALSLGREFEDFFEDNPLPDLFSVRVRTKYAPRTADMIRGFQGVQSVDPIGAGIDASARPSRYENTLIFLSGGSLTVGAILLISLGLRTKTRAMEGEHHILFLLGASRGFISAPVILEGAILGLLGAAIGLILAQLIHSYVLAGSPLFGTKSSVSAQINLPAFYQAALFLLSGLLSGLAGGIISSGRLLRGGAHSHWPQKY